MKERQPSRPQEITFPGYDEIYQDPLDKKWITCGLLEL
jgi:hypothetical protein